MKIPLNRKNIDKNVNDSEPNQPIKKEEPLEIIEETITNTDTFQEIESTIEDNSIEDEFESNPFATEKNSSSPFDSGDNPFASNENSSSPFDNGDNPFENESEPIAKPIDTSSISQKETKNTPSVFSGDLEIDSEMPYFFVFGNSTAGKSVMLAGLLYYLKTGDIGQLHSLGESDKQNHRKGDAILRDMMRNVRGGKFLVGSQRLDTTKFVFPTEINLEFKPNNSKPVMPFCLLEMAGEDLKEIQLQNNGETGGDFDPRIKAYIEHPECDIIFICVVDVDKPEDSEDLIDEFLNYIYKNGHEDNPVLIVVNKWDKVKNEYETVEDYIKKNLPLLRGNLKNSEREMAYMSFSIGDVSENGSGATYDYKPNDSAKLFKWMYSISTGLDINQEMEKSLFGGITSSIKNIFSNE